MVAQNFSSLTLTAINAALKAGDILKEGYGGPLDISMKAGRQNFVTNFDKLAENCIISTIKETFPFHHFLAEESGRSHYSEDSILWIIDPLDGTTNFVHNIPCFAVSIAAYERQKALCGVIYQPLTNELYVAESQRGAFLNGCRLQVSQVNNFEEALIAIALREDQISSTPISIDVLFNLTQKGAVLRSFGSAALSLAYVASGKADAFWMHQIYPWDFAAGKILIEEAGGVFNSFDGNKVLDDASNILASNQALHKIFYEHMVV